jgi:MFS family permease
MAAGAALMALTGKLTDRGWIKYVGVGLSFLSLPLMLWGSVPALFAAVLMMGVFAGPAYNALGTYFYKNIPAGKAEGTIAVRGSIFNGAISMGYGIMGLLTSRLHMAFPGLLWPIVGAALVIGLGFLFLPKLLPGLPGKSLKDKKTDA